MSFQGIEVRFEPLYEFGDTVVQGGGGLVAALALQLGGVGIGLEDIALLHGQEYLVGLYAQGALNLINEIHQLYRLR